MLRSALNSCLAAGRRCCFLTATPRNKSAWDVYHQIKLFHQDDRTDLPVDPPNLKEYFKLIDKAERKLPDLLAHILVRRTRQHILRWYGFDAETHEHILQHAGEDTSVEIGGVLACWFAVSVIAQVAPLLRALQP